MTFHYRKERRHGWVIIRVGFPYDYHSHLSTEAGCQQLMRLIEMGLEPRSERLQQSARRLLTDEEYRGLKRVKDKYVNRGRFL